MVMSMDASYFTVPESKSVALIVTVYEPAEPASELICILPAALRLMAAVKLGAMPIVQQSSVPASLVKKLAVGITSTLSPIVYDWL